MNRNDTISVALSALAEIRNAHEDFWRVLATYRVRDTRTGDIALRDHDKSIDVTCLGVPIRCQYRPVCAENRNWSYEYEFVSSFRNAELVVFRMYLSPFETLHSDQVDGPILCKTNVENLPAKITDAIAAALLRSDVFRVKTPD